MDAWRTSPPSQGHGVFGAHVMVLVGRGGWPPDQGAIAGADADTDGRGCYDLTGDLGAISQPNLGQSEIDALMKPAKVAL